MDINELKKLINEEVQKTRQKNLLKEQEETGWFRVSSDPFNQSLFNKDGLNVLFNLIRDQSYPEEIQTLISQALSEINQKYPISNYGQVIEMKKKLEREMRNIALITELFGHGNRQELSKEEVLKMLKSPETRQSIESTFHALLPNSEIALDISHALSELIKDQPKSQQPLPLAKTIRPGPAKAKPGSLQNTWDIARGGNKPNK